MNTGESKKGIILITRTAILTALLVTLQWLTGGFGQFVTGTAVNCILAIAALSCGIAGGLAIAAISPWVAFLLGIGPGLVQIIPCISLGNMVFVTVLWLVIRQPNAPVIKKVVGISGAAVAKFVTLYLLVIKVFIPLMGASLKEKQIAVFSAMFSWPQLITAFAGAVLAIIILPLVKRGQK